jgi:hypothetical protein
VRELAVAEPDGGAEVGLAVRALVAELDQLADDGIEIRDLLQRRGGRPIGGVLDRAR